MLVKIICTKPAWLELQIQYAEHLNPVSQATCTSPSSSLHKTHCETKLFLRTIAFNSNLMNMQTEFSTWTFASVFSAMLIVSSS